MLSIRKVFLLLMCILYFLGYLKMMKNANVVWFGPNFNDSIAMGRLHSAIRDHCGEESENFNVFAMDHDAPNKSNFIFYVGCRLFLGIYVERSLLVIEDDHLNIRKLIAILHTTEVTYAKLHFVEEFEEFLNNY